MEMKDKIYIRSSSCISAQDTFADPAWYNNIRSPESNLYRCVEPDYRDIIDAASLRRMNRIQKFGLSTALYSLRRVTATVDAIIFATGWGCVDSTYKFLERLFDGEELPLNPAVFIQSTHNTIAAQTAIYLKNKSYNNTITDNRLPFELAMDNAILCLQDNDCRNVLLGACDEMTPRLTDILNRIAKFGSSGLYGEGGACFMLSKEKEDSIAEIIYFNSVPEKDTPGIINDLLDKYSTDYIFTPRKRDFPENVPQVLYTDYFGDFPTSAACGFWLAIDCLNSRNPMIPNARNILMVSGDKYGIEFIVDIRRTPYLSLSSQ
jgi:hypothetical protein